MAKAQDAPIPPAELEKWGGVIAIMQACDKAAGITDPGTVAAAAAYRAAAAANGRRL